MALRLPLPRRRTYVGIDVGSTAIKAVEVAGRRGAYRVLAADREETPAGVLVDGDIMDPAALAAALTRLVERHRWQGRTVFTAVGSSKTIIRHLHLPPMPPAELPQAARWEAEKYLPLNLEELSLDFASLGPEVVEGREQVVVLLAALPTYLGHQYYDLFQEAGLELAAIDLVPLALERVLVGRAGGPEAVLEIGAAASWLLVSASGRLEFCRALKAGGRDVARAAAATLGLPEDQALAALGATHRPAGPGSTGPALVSFPGSRGPQGASGEGASGPAEAAAARARPGEPADGRLSGAGAVLGALQVEMILQGGLSDLVTEARRSLDFFQAQRKETSLERLVVSGGLANLPGLAEFLAQELGLPVLAGLTRLPQTLPDNSFALALGLALREVA